MSELSTESACPDGKTEVRQHNKNTTPHPTSGGSYSYDSILYSICQEENIKFQLFSLNWVKRLEKDGQIRYITGYKFDLNSDAASRIADDKFATSLLLHDCNIPAVEHEILYPFTNHQDYALGHNSPEVVKKFFAVHDRHIVLKPNCGTGGRQVHQITTSEQLTPALMDIFAYNAVAAMSPFYEVKYEHRVILLDGEVRLAYTKKRADDKDWRFNLQNGAIAVPIRDEIFDHVVELAQQAIAALNLRFGSVDITETVEGELLVLEINSGVMTEVYSSQHPEQVPMVREMYRDAIRKMFGK